MNLFLLGLLAMAACDKSSKPKKKGKKSYSRRVKRDNSWLDAAWFHDHNQRI